MRVTKKLLQELNACEDQVEAFAAEWPDGCEITAENLTRCIALGLNIEWFATLIWGAEYERQRSPLWAEYERQRAPLWAEYKRQQCNLILRLAGVAPGEEGMCPTK